jgi:IS1 family transposase
MNVLPIEKKTLILSLLCEGQSVRATSRIADVSPVTTLKLLLEAGEKAREIHDTQMVGLQSNYIQVDEIWSYIGKKQKQTKPLDSEELGDQYVFVAMDSETKLVPAFMVGKRNGSVALSFMDELKYRIRTRFQLSTDAFAPYFNAVDTVFGSDVDYGQIHKEYKEEAKGEKRYSPAQIIRVTIKSLIGNPKRKRISTSHIERQNLTMRMQMRRFTRLTNAFSKSLKHHKAAIALHFFFYNFVRIHETLRVTPAMEANVTNRLWNWADLLTWGTQRIAA